MAIPRLRGMIWGCCDCELPVWGGMVDRKINLLHESHQFRTHGCVISGSWEGNKQKCWGCLLLFAQTKNMDLIILVQDSIKFNIIVHSMFQTINRKCVQQLSQSTARFNFSNVSIFLRSFCRLQNTVCLLTFCTKPSVTSSRSGMAADIVLNCSITLHFFLVNLTFSMLKVVVILQAKIMERRKSPNGNREKCNRC